MYGRAAVYVDKILKGDRPSDLPLQAVEKYELVVNLKTAKPLGLNISEAFLLRADEVIDNVAHSLQFMSLLMALSSFAPLQHYV